MSEGFQIALVFISVLSTAAGFLLLLDRNNIVKNNEKDNKQLKESLDEFKKERRDVLQNVLNDIHEKIQNLIIESSKTHAEQWTEINKLKDNRVLCQKHEDQLSAILSKMEEIKESVYKARNTATEAKSYVDNKIQEFQKLIKNH